MIQLRWHGTIICLDFSFFAIAAWIALIGGERLFWEILFTCLLHELGHLTAMVCFHRRVQRIIFCGVGVTIQPAGDYAGYWQDQIVLLAGPLANLCFGSVLWLVHGINELGMLHFGLGLFNLMPYARLDGGSILYAALSAKNMPPDRAERILNGISLCFSAGLFIIGICFHFRNISLYVMVLYLLIVQFALNH